jgi:hypothetical protein
VQELLKLVSHQGRKDLVSTESYAEVGPRHLMTVLNSGGEISPPSTRGPTKLLGREQSLLELMPCLFDLQLFKKLLQTSAAGKLFGWKAKAVWQPTFSDANLLE